MAGIAAALTVFNFAGVLTVVTNFAEKRRSGQRSCTRSAGHSSTRPPGHPWNWAAHEAGGRTPRKNEFSRWNAGKDLSFVPLRPERVVEVRYDHMEGQRFRHTAQFNRWRPDRDPRSCTYSQLETPVTFRLGDIVPGLG
jgi:hypothetical protein